MARCKARPSNWFPATKLTLRGMEVGGFRRQGARRSSQVHQGIRQQLGAGSRQAASRDQLSRNRIEIARCRRRTADPRPGPRLSVGDAGEAIARHGSRAGHAAAGSCRSRRQVVPCFRRSRGRQRYRILSQDRTGIRACRCNRRRQGSSRGQQHRRPSGWRCDAELQSQAGAGNASHFCDSCFVSSCFISFCFASSCKDMDLARCHDRQRMEFPGLCHFRAVAGQMSRPRPGA